MSGSERGRAGCGRECSTVGARLGEGEAREHEDNVGCGETRAKCKKIDFVGKRGEAAGMILRKGDEQVRKQEMVQLAITVGRAT